MIKQFLRYVLPSMAAFAFSGLYSIVDGYFVGNNVGDAGLAAINIAYPMIALVNAVGTGIGIGGAVFVSLTRGEGDAESEKKYLGNTLLFLLGASVVCTLLLLAVYRPFLQAFGATVEVLEGAKTYSLVLILCTALQVFATGCIPLLRNFGAAVGAMLAMSGGFVSNIFLDWLFVQYMSLGLFGAALATGIGQAVTVVPCAVFLFLRIRKMGGGVFSFSLRRIGKIAAVGASPFGLTLCPNITTLILNKFCLEFGGDTAVAAYAVVAYMYSVILFLLQGVGDGAQPLVSACYGEGQEKTAKKFRNYAYVTALVTALVYFLALLFCRELIPKAFGTSDEAGALAARVLPIFGAGTLFTAIIKVTSSYFYSIGKSKVSYGLVYGELAIVFAAAFALSSFLKLDGVWLALPLTQAVLCVAAIAILFALSRKNKFKNI